MAIDAGRQMAEPSSRPAIAVSKREYAKAESQHTEFMVADRSRSREVRSQYTDASELYDRGRYKEAAALYETAAREGHRSDTAWYNAACCWAMGGESAKALDALQASFDEGFDRLRYYAEDTDLDSLRGDPRFRKFMDGVMNSDVAKRQRRSALREFEYLEKQKTVDEGDWNSVGVDLMRTGDYPNAETAFDREYKNTGRGTALYNMACLKAVSGKPDDALTYLDRAIRAGSGDPDHMVEDPDLRTLHDRDRFDQLVDFADDMQLQSHDSWSWGWGRKSEARRWRKSLDHFEEMTKTYPDVGRAWFNLGFAQLKAGFPKESAGSFQKALDMKYSTSTTMYNLACANAQAGNVDAAYDWLERAQKDGHKTWRYARGDRDLDPLRDDPRWDKLTRTWKEQAEAAGEHWNWNWSHGGSSNDDHDHDHDHDNDDDDERYD
jgi:tetratricopeptide (TPR) repeat protein